MKIQGLYTAAHYSIFFYENFQWFVTNLEVLWHSSSGIWMFKSVSLVNWCQHWFEYFPNPPLNILSMAENVLAHHDKELLQHLVDCGITSQVTGAVLCFKRRGSKLCRHMFLTCLRSHVIVRPWICRSSICGPCWRPYSPRFWPVMSGCDSLTRSSPTTHHSCSWPVWPISPAAVSLCCSAPRNRTLR